MSHKKIVSYDIESVSWTHEWRRCFKKFSIFKLETYSSFMRLSSRTSRTISTVQLREQWGRNVTFKQSPLIFLIKLMSFTEFSKTVLISRLFLRSETIFTNDLQFLVRAGFFVQTSGRNVDMFWNILHAIFAN